jgi:hypothetical protein
VPTTVVTQGEGSREAARAVVREFETQHERLRLLFASLHWRVSRVVSDPTSGAGRTAVVHLFVELEQRLPEHFAFEERGGYLSDALAIAPRLSKWAAQLAEDHPIFLEQLRELVRDAHEAAADDSRQPWEQIAVRVQKLASALGEHELEENRLVQQAFSEDIGGG